MSNDVKIRLTLTDNVSKQLTKVSKGFDKIGGRGAGASLFGNVGAKGIAKGFDLIGDAAYGAVGFLKDSVNAARDAEVSEGQLALALKNNVAGWNGSTDAIEELLTAQMRLGFSDDEQRDGLTKLITATGDVAESEKALGVAMDVARFKHIPLADAVDLVNKAMHGNNRALKQLGIQMPKNSTATQILDAMTGKLKGSAEAYSTTLDGKVDAAQVRFQEAQETLGKIVTPALTFAIDGLSNSLLYMSGDPTMKATGALLDIENGVAALRRGIDKVNDAWLDFTNALPGMGNFESGTFHGTITKNGNKLVPNGPSGVTIQGVNAQQLAQIIDKEMYVQLRRAGTGR